MDSTNDALEYGEHTEAAARAMRQQAEVQAAAEARRRARAMVVPTDDREVRVWLRRLSEPVTVFGERAMERRERLRSLMATLSDEQRMELTARVMQLDIEQKKTQLERFFTEGAPELVNLRKRICSFAAKRAGDRLSWQQAAFEDNGVGIAEEHHFVLGDASRLHNVSSQIGGRRPLQGCEISPDGTTLATADWDGIVSMWTLEDKLVRLSVSQALVSEGGSVGADTLAYATSSADGTAKLWNIQGKCMHTLEGHTGRLARSAFHPTDFKAIVQRCLRPPKGDHVQEI